MLTVLLVLKVIGLVIAISLMAYAFLLLLIRGDECLYQDDKGRFHPCDQIPGGKQ